MTSSVNYHGDKPVALNLSPGADNAIMRNHLKIITRFFKGVYMPHHAGALLLHDISIPDVLRSVQVRIFPVAAGHTMELQTNTVPLSNMSTSWTSLRCVGWIYCGIAYSALLQLKLRHGGGRENFKDHNKVRFRKTSHKKLERPER
jgi:hypothetical protein